MFTKDEYKRFVSNDLSKKNFNNIKMHSMYVEISLITFSGSGRHSQSETDPEGIPRDISTF